VKRITIFSFYDEEGIVDSYVCYLLNEIKSVSERIIFTVNGYIDKLARRK
jgi:rhamnosyltransferase